MANLSDNIGNSIMIIFWLYRILMWLIYPFVYLMHFIPSLNGRFNIDKRLFLDQNLTDINKKEIDLWFHGASVGEVKMCIYLAQEILIKRVHISCQTKSGWDVLFQSTLSENISYSFVPLDCQITLSRFYKLYNPKSLFLYELEIWPEMLAFCIAKKIPIKIISAKINDNLGFVYQSLFKIRLFRNQNPIIAIEAQSKSDVANFEKVFKFVKDRPLVSLSGDWKILKSSVFVEKLQKSEVAVDGNNNKNYYFDIVLISVHKEEWGFLSSFWYSYKGKNPNAKLVIIPRYLKEINFFAKELLDLKQKFTIFSDPKKNLDYKFIEDIVIVNKFGEVKNICSMSKIGFMGGSFAPKIGIHDFREALSFGLKLFVGPYYHLHKDVIEYYQEKQLLKIVKYLEDINCENIPKSHYNKDFYNKLNNVFKEEFDLVKSRKSSSLPFFG